jgi:heme O synthase-like polyprenyltransferase
MGTIYLAGAGIGGAVFVATSLRLVIEPSRKRAIQNFLASLLQLVLLIAGVIVDRVVGSF